MVRSIGKLRSFQFPFATERIFTARVGLFDSEYPDTAARRRFFRELDQRMRTSARSAACDLDRQSSHDGRPDRHRVPRESLRRGGEYPEAQNAVIGLRYFETFGVRLLEGRDFDERDGAGAPPVAIVNQPFADKYLDGKALGQRFALRAGRDSLGTWLTVWESSRSPDAGIRHR